nr:ATP-binding cassette domain-containing protein [Haloactinomyces albus]
MGPSGSGKSTLMHCLAGLDTVASGSVVLGDTEIVGLGDKQLTLLRRQRVGFVFQTFNLLPTLTAEQNIHLPLDIAGRRDLDPAWRDQVIDTLGLRDRLGHRPGEMSGGQQQRVACARSDHPPGGGLRRRADRQPRLPLRGGGAVVSAHVGQRAGPDRGDGHPRRGRGQLRRAGGVSA